MGIIIKILTVLLTSTVEGIAAIALSLGFGINKWFTILIVAIGGVIGVYIAAFLGKRIKAYITKLFPKKEKDTEKKPSKFWVTLWHKYELYGLAVGAFFLGGPATIGVGLGFNADLQKLVRVVAAVVVVRTIVFTLLGNVIKGWL